MAAAMTGAGWNPEAAVRAVLEPGETVRWLGVPAPPGRRSVPPLLSLAFGLILLVTAGWIAVLWFAPHVPTEFALAFFYVLLVVTLLGL